MYDELLRKGEMSESPLNSPPTGGDPQTSTQTHELGAE